MKKIQAFFKEADKSGDGMVSRDEFDAMLESPSVRQWFKGLDMHVHEYVALFNLIDDGDGHISVEEFMDGVARLKGQARSIDMLGVVREVRKVKQYMVMLLEQFNIGS